MPSDLTTGRLTRARSFSRAASATVVAIACLALAGWLLDIPVLRSIGPGPGAMNPMTAVCFMLAGTSLWLARDETPGPRKGRLARICAAVVVVVGLIRIAEELLGGSLVIDRVLLATKLDQAGPGTLGRMAVLTALDFVLLGASLLTLDRESRWGLRPAEMLALPAAVIAVARLTGYVYGTSAFYRLPLYTSMAFNTALAFIVLFAGILAARPERGLMRVLTSDTDVGASLRRFAPLVVAGPLALGWLLLLGQRASWYDAELGLALMIVGATSLFALLVFWNAHQLFHQETGRAKFEQALRASEEQFRALAETANDAIVSADSDGRIVYWNPGAERLFGYTWKDVLGQPLPLLMPERFRDAHRQGFQRFLATGEARVIGRTVELSGLRKDGDEFPIELSLAVWSTHEGRSFTAIIRDISERKQAESELRRSQQELQEYIDGMSTLNARVAPDGTILLVNRIAQQAFGLSMEQLLKTNFLEGQWWAFDPEVKTRVEEAFRRACAGETISYDEKLFVFGTVVDINFGLVPVKDSRGHVRYVIAEGRDITSLKQSEKALSERTAQLEVANQGLESFSYSVSHDLRAPLRAIDGFSRILLEEQGKTLDAEARRLLLIIRSNTTRMGQLIDDLLTFSRLSRRALSVSTIDVQRLVAGVVDDLRKDTTDKAEVIVGALPPSHGDGSLLRQVWVNLIGNALKFSRTRPRPRVEIGGRKDSRETVYFVRDNGVGFDLAHAGKLFGVFERLHRSDEFEGTGVGLAIVKRVVERHGGRVWAEAKPEEGATFHFALPGKE